MARRRGLIVLAISAALVAACGASGSSPTQGPGGNGGPNPTGTTGESTAGPGGSTTSPGGGGGSGNQPAGWDKYGKVTFSVSGPATASGELGFVPAGSVFGGTQQSLSFFDEQTSAILTLRFDGAKGFATYGATDMSFTSEACTVSDLRLEPASGSGGFDCTGAVITGSGAILTGARLQGTFTAHP